MRVRVRTALLALLSVALALVAARWAYSLRIPEIPRYESAMDYQESLGLIAYRLEFSYLVRGEESDEVVRHYSGWARQVAWPAVSAAEERWGSKEWQSFEDLQRDSRSWIHQRGLHWRDVESRWSLRIAMRQVSGIKQRDPSAEIEVFGFVEPYRLLRAQTR